jgi:hypothetical protein
MTEKRLPWLKRALVAAESVQGPAHPLSQRLRSELVDVLEELAGEADELRAELQRCSEAAAVGAGGEVVLTEEDMRATQLGEARTFEGGYELGRCAFLHHN